MYLKLEQIYSSLNRLSEGDRRVYIINDLELYLIGNTCSNNMIVGSIYPDEPFPTTFIVKKIDEIVSLGYLVIPFYNIKFYDYNRWISWPDNLLKYLVLKFNPFQYTLNTAINDLKNIVGARDNIIVLRDIAYPGSSIIIGSKELDLLAEYYARVSLEFEVPYIDVDAIDDGVKVAPGVYFKGDLDHNVIVVNVAYWVDQSAWCRKRPSLGFKRFLYDEVMGALDDILSILNKYTVLLEKYNIPKHIIKNFIRAFKEITYFNPPRPSDIDTYAECTYHYLYRGLFKSLEALGSLLRIFIELNESSIVGQLMNYMIKYVYLFKSLNKGLKWISVDVRIKYVLELIKYITLLS